MVVWLGLALVGGLGAVRAHARHVAPRGGAPGARGSVLHGARVLDGARHVQHAALVGWGSGAAPASHRNGVDQALNMACERTSSTARSRKVVMIGCSGAYLHTVRMNGRHGLSRAQRIATGSPRDV